MPVNIYVLSVIMISMICAILTIAVYLYVKILLNTLGKCIVSCLSTMVVLHLLLIIANLKLLEEGMCVAHTLIFFMSAYFIWYSVISYHCWQTIKPVKREEHRHQFLVYSAFVWITTAGTVAFSIFEALVLESEYRLHTLTIFNFIMFILTAINIWKVKREIKRFERQKETTTTCFNFDTQTYAIYLRISVIIGVSWIFGTIHFIFYIADYEDSAFSTYLKVHLCFGILYFVLLVLKRSTLKLFMDSIRERRNEKRVRAQMKKDLAEISIQRKA